MTPRASSARLTFICVAMFLASCVNLERSPYLPFSKTNGGYSNETVDDRTSVARFSGNTHTDPEIAELLARFRAIELCAEDGNRFARIIDKLDHSEERSVFRSKSSGSASGFVYGNTAFAGGEREGSSWRDDYLLPVIAVRFQCAEESYSIGVDVRKLSAKSVSPYVKDLLGAVQVTATRPGNPNKATLRVGDIVLRVDGERVRSPVSLDIAVNESTNKNRINLQIIRDGKLESIHVRAIDITAKTKEDNKKVVEEACAFRDVANRSICTPASRIPAKATR